MDRHVILVIILPQLHPQLFKGSGDFHQTYLRTLAYKSSLIQKKSKSLHQFRNYDATDRHTEILNLQHPPFCVGR